MTSWTSGHDADAPNAGNRQKVTNEIISSLRGQIARGNLARGEKLPNEKDLAAHYGVSQPTMREAVRALDAMGLLDVHHGRGAFVAQDLSAFVSNSLHTFIEFEQVGLVAALDVRAVLGKHSARQAAANATQADKDALILAARACRDAAGLDSMLAMARTVVDFQSAIPFATKNALLYSVESFLIRLLLQLQVDAKVAYGAAYWSEQLRAFEDDRETITRYICDGDEENAERAMTKYLDDQKALFERDPDMARIRFTRRPRVGRTLLDG